MKGAVMKTVLLIAGAAAMLLLSPGPSAGQVDADLSAFAARTVSYAALHREVAGSLPPMWTFTDPAAGLATAAALREAIRAARPAAREGALFGSAAGALRRVTRRALRQAGIEPADLLADMRADTEDGARVPAVDATFPWAVGNLMPPVLLNALPPLPAELEYRLVGPDLVLIDIDANLVVDILRAALADTTR
jgi:hypothetical protein